MDQTMSTVYQRLIEVARGKSVINYSDAGQLVGLDMDNEVSRIRIAQILDDINNYEGQHGRPMLSAVVIRKDINMPGSGFFDCAWELGRYSGTNDLMVWITELNKVHDYWQSHKGGDTFPE